MPHETAAISARSPYNHAPCHFMQSHIRKVYACLSVTCHLHFWQNDRGLLRATAVTRGWNGYRNKSQHRKLTLEKKTLPPLYRTNLSDQSPWFLIKQSHTIISSYQLLHNRPSSRSHSQSAFKPISLTIGLQADLTHNRPSSRSHSQSAFKPISLTIGLQADLTHNRPSSRSHSQSAFKPISLTIGLQADLTHNRPSSRSHSQSAFKPISLTIGLQADLTYSQVKHEH